MKDLNLWQVLNLKTKFEEQKKGFQESLSFTSKFEKMKVS